MSEFLDTWGITLMLFAPLAGALLMMGIPKTNELLAKQVALGASLVSAFFGILLFINFDYDNSSTLQFLVDKRWIEVIDTRYAIGIDGISLPLIALTLFVVPLVIIYTWNHVPSPGNAKAFLMLTLVLHTGMLGVFVARDLILFFVFFEVTLLPMYFMIGVWGGPQRQYAAIKFFLYTLFGSALMLVSFLSLYWLTGADTFNIVELASRVQSENVSLLAQVLLSVECSWALVSKFQSSHSTLGYLTLTLRLQLKAL